MATKKKETRGRKEKTGTSRQLIRLNDDSWKRLKAIAKRRSKEEGRQVSIGDVVEDVLAKSWDQVEG